MVCLQVKVCVTRYYIRNQRIEITSAETGLFSLSGVELVKQKKKIVESTLESLEKVWHAETEEFHEGKTMKGDDHASHKPEKLKGNRSIDTLFRTAYRAQLDMLSLAAMKANIMISLNGLLMSIIIITGSSAVDFGSRFVVPVAMLLITCAVATVFAILAARPNISRKYFRPDDFDSDRATLLDFEEFTDMDENEFTEVMMRMLGSRQRVYRNMIAHVYELGTVADRSYRNLFYSYTAFMIGIVLTVVVLLTLEGMKRMG